MWHGGQVSQKQHNNQRTQLQQKSHTYVQLDVSTEPSSGSWGRTPIPSGSTGPAAGQQYASAGGRLMPASYAVFPSGQVSMGTVQQQQPQLAATVPQQQISLIPHQQYAVPGHTVQQPWVAPATWSVQPQLLVSQPMLQQRQQQLQVLQQQQQLHQQMHQQQLQPPHHQLRQLQPQTEVSLVQPPGIRGWGGQRLPYVHQSVAPLPEPTYPNARLDSSSGRGRGRGGAGGGDGRGWRGGHGGRGRSGTDRYPAGGHSDALVHQIYVSIRQQPRGQAPQDIVADRLAALDGRGLAMLLKQLANNGLTAQAWELFDWLRSLEPRHELTRLLDVFSYTAMISQCSSNRRDMEVALALSREMPDRGVSRNVHTFSALMNVCIKSGQYQAALDVWRELQETGCRPNVVTYNTLIDAYGKTGNWAEALKVLARMKEEGMEPVTRTYSTLMIACNSSNQWHEALSVYHQMLAAGHAPNTTTYNALITVYSKAGRLEKVMETLREMEAAGCERTVITYSALISACERDGQWELALQMFSQMLREGCVPNVITYNSLITALAAGSQWERAMEVFVQLQRQGCEPDVVSYTALINAYEKGGQWRRAIQAFECMLHQGCRTDHVVFGAVIDALWDSGVSAAQSRAVRIYRAAMADGCVKPIGMSSIAPSSSAISVVSGMSSGAGKSRGAYPATTGPADPSGAVDVGDVGDVREFLLAALATGSAIVAFLAFLADQRERAIDMGPEASLPARVVFRFLRSRCNRDVGMVLPLRDALCNWLQTRGSPFRVVVQESSTAVFHRLEAAGPDVAAWLLKDSMAIALLQYGGGSFATSTAVGSRDILGAGLEGSADEVVQDAELEVFCRDAFEEVRRFETTHCLKVAAMGAAYMARRGDLARNVLNVASVLELPRDVAHDAVQLLDRLMSAAPQLREDLFPMAAVTSLRILAVGGGMGRQVPSRSSSSGARPLDNAQKEADFDVRLAQATGLPTLGLQSMELNIQSALLGDVSAVSALRCLQLYCQRLGLGGDSVEAEDLQDPVAPSLRLLLDEALRDEEFLNYRPSATAAAVLYCHRLRRGTTPLWPSAAASLTGYPDLEQPELAAAVGAVQRLIMELSTSKERT